MPLNHGAIEAGQHVARMLLNLFALYVAARLAGWMAVRLRQPVVVGEILAGVLIGPHALGLVHYQGSEEFFELFAELGVVFLLFVVGLETDPTALWRVGRQAALVAFLGVAAPFSLGYLLTRALGFGPPQALFVGAALTATSVGITARVFGDLGQLATRVARVILGAAVLDDILGISVLSVVQGATGSGISFLQLAVLVVEAAAFIAIALLLARPAVHRITPRLAGAESETRSPIFAFAVTLCLGFSALAASIRLAAIIGAFFAGMLFAETEEAEQLRASMRPIYELLVPIFFVFMGLQVNLSLFTTAGAWGVALLIIGVAALGKLVACGLAALPLGRREAITIGVGMIPRGEVGIVVALAGLRAGVLSGYLYAVIIFMSVATSILAPPFLRLLLSGRGGTREQARDGEVAR